MIFVQEMCLLWNHEHRAVEVAMSSSIWLCSFLWETQTTVFPADFYSVFVQSSSLLPWRKRKRKRRLFYLQILCVLWCIAWSKEGALAQEGTMILLQERCLSFTRSMELWGGGSCDCVHSSSVKHKATFFQMFFTYVCPKLVQFHQANLYSLKLHWCAQLLALCNVPCDWSWAHSFAFVMGLSMQLATEWSFAYNLKPNILSLLALMPRSPEIFATMPEPSSLLKLHRHC